MKSGWLFWLTIAVAVIALVFMPEIIARISDSLGTTPVEEIEETADAIFKLV